MISSAVLSHCETYRYRLERRWGEGKPLVFVMLNPSTADDRVDDPTIRRCVGFAKSHGFNAIEVVNLYAWRATKPKDLKTAGYPVGDDNDAHITEAVSGAGAVCVAWGDKAAGLARPADVLRLLKSLGVAPMALELTDRGIPRHPLMLRADCKLKPFPVRA